MTSFMKDILSERMKEYFIEKSFQKILKIL